MTYIDEMIKELCPDGVEWKELGEVCEIVRGNGLQKKDFLEAGVPCIHYGQIYTYYGLSAIKTKSFVSPELATKLRKASYGDVIVATTSENIEDVGKSLAWFGDEEVCFGGHSCVLKTELLAKYLVYYMRTAEFQKQKEKMVIGTKVIELYPKNLARIKVPVPPLKIQKEIVKMLDKFTDYVTELTAELTLRQKQYAFYRDKLLSFEDEVYQVEWKTLGEVADIGTGSGNSNEGLESGDYPFFVRSQEVKYKNEYEFDETAIITAGDGVGVGKVFHYFSGKYALHQRAYRIRIIDETVNSRYVFHYFKTNFLKYIQKASYHASVTSIRKPMMIKFPIPIPTLDIQSRIVQVLDNFDTVCNDLNIGLPKEIELRQKQYEFFRDKLLTFTAEGVYTDSTVQTRPN